MLFIYEFLNVSRLIISSNRWRTFQSSLIMNELLIGFMAVFMTFYGVSESNILLLFAFIYMSVSFFFVFLKKIVEKKEKAFFNIGFSFLTLLILISYFLSEFYQIVALLLSAILSLIFKDFFSVNNLKSIKEIGDKNNVNSMQVITTSLLVSTFIISVATGLMGIIFDNDSSTIFKIILFFVFIVIYQINKNPKIKESKGIKKHPEIKYRKNKSSIDLHLFCALNTAYGSIYFLFIRFVMPLAVIDLAIQYGSSEDVFKYIGSILGIFSMLGLLTNIYSKKRTLLPERMTYLSFFVSMISIILISIIYYYLKNFDDVNLNISLSVIAILFSVFILFNRFWSICFMETLKQKSESTCSYDSDFNYNKNLSLYMAYKNIGAFSGFIVAYIMMFLFGLKAEFIIVILSVLSLIYLSFVLLNNKIKKSPGGKGIFN